MNATPWARYVRRTSGDATGSEIEKRTGIRQSNISRWLNEGTIPQPAQAAKFAQAYGANVLEAFVAAGFLTEEEAGTPPRPEIDFFTLVDDDPDLSEQSKIHLKNQYGLLKAASAHGRVAQAREMIEQDPDLDDATRQRLLGHFDSAKIDLVFSSGAHVVEHSFGSGKTASLVSALSEGSDTPDLAIAAHDEEAPIAGEQEQPTEA